MLSGAGALRLLVPSVIIASPHPPVWKRRSASRNLAINNNDPDQDSGSEITEKDTFKLYLGGSRGDLVKGLDASLYQRSEGRKHWATRPSTDCYSRSRVSVCWATHRETSE